MDYQERYQINDIRGIKEDEEAGRKNRLPLGDDLKHSVGESATVFMAILFKVFRIKEWKKFIFYALAQNICPLFVRFFSVVPFGTVITDWISGISIICLRIAFYANGTFSSILSWINEIAKGILGEHAFYLMASRANSNEK